MNYKDKIKNFIVTCPGGCDPMGTAALQISETWNPGYLVLCD